MGQFISVKGGAPWLGEEGVTKGRCVSAKKHAHKIHVWYIYLHELVGFYGNLVGKYTSSMDPMGWDFKISGFWRFERTLLYKNRVKQTPLF